MSAPLTPANCNLQDFPRMMIDIPRLRGSEFDAILDDGAWRAGLNLWLTSWHQVPAASLSDDDASLAKAAGLGRDVRTWKKVKAEALRGWLKCTDGLLYHPVVAEMALEAWLEKLAQALSSGAGNAKRWGGTFDPAPIEAEIDQCAGMLAALNPKSKALAKAIRRKSRPTDTGNPDGTENPSRRDTKDVPSGSQETGTGKGIEDRPPNPPEGGCRQDRFAEGWGAYPLAGRGNSGPAKSEAEWPGAAQRAGGEEALIGAIKAHSARLAKDGGKAKNFDRWLRDDGFAAYLGQQAAKPAAAWSGPDDVWAEVVRAMGEDLATSYLGQCRWQGAPIMAVVAPHEFAAGKLRSAAGAALAALGFQIIVETGRAA